MDLTPEYIKMCEEAKKFIPQEIKYGDWVNVGIISDLVTYDSAISPGELFACGFYIVGNEKLFTKLYRQDQLQEMIFDTNDRKLSLLEKWTDKTYQDHLKPWGFFKSFEQLWLAFVMKEKYSKTWDNGTWI